jgi:hypothetical protein
LGGSAPLSIGGGVLGDCFKPEERGQAIAIYSLAPLLGPVIAPVCGGWYVFILGIYGDECGPDIFICYRIAERSTWRWVFWSTSIVDAAIQVFGFFYLDECTISISSSMIVLIILFFPVAFAPLLLERKANRIRKSLDPEKGQHRNIRTVFQSDDRHWKRIFAKALIRPFALFVYEPIVQLLGVYMAFIYGVMYCEFSLLMHFFAIASDDF